MKQCGARPYEGSEKYIFLSYCHDDKPVVFPVAERLARDGYRVWYDEGIHPGEEWPEIIAEHLNGCAACIAFVSENSLNSHNCRKEINFALLKKKPLISVVTEEVKLSPGMELQLSSVQAIFRYTLSSDAEFFEKLYAAECLRCCMGTPNPDIRVSSPEDYPQSDSGLFSENERDSFSDKWFVSDSLPKENVGSQPRPSEEKPADLNPDEARLVSAGSGDGINVTSYESKLVRESSDDHGNEGKASNHPLSANPPPVPESVTHGRVVPEPSKAEYVPKPVPTAPVKPKKRKGSFKARLVCAILCGAVLCAAGAVIIPNALRPSVSDSASVSFKDQTLTAKDTAKIASTRGMENLFFFNCVFENGAEKELAKIKSGLNAFTMRGCEGVSDLSFLSVLNPSVRLEISDCGLTDSVLDTAGLKECPVTLILSDNPELSSLKILERLPELPMWELDISGTAVSDLSPLERCTQLTTLRANNCNITELSSIEKISAGSSPTGKLSLYLNSNKISDLTPLRSCKINHLEFSDNEISTLEPLSDIETLDWLAADRNKLTSLAGLENSLSLTHLSACENKITELSGITNCTILKWVDLSKNGISDISLLSKSKQALEGLYLNGNPLDNIHVLDGFDALQYLNIDDTSVSELPQGCTGLIGISAQNNRLLTASELQNCPELEYVFLADNNILLAGDFSSNKLKVCDLSGNGFNFVSANNWGSLAAVYNNPIGEAISVPEEYPYISEKANNNREAGIALTAEKLILSYNDSIDFSGLVKRGIQSFAVIDCPKDKQLSLKSLLSDSNCTVNFITPEEARKEILSGRVHLDGFSTK